MKIDKNTETLYIAYPKKMKYIMHMVSTRIQRVLVTGNQKGGFQNEVSTFRRQSRIKQLEAEETTKSGIVLPGNAQEKPQQAEIIAVGPGGIVDGKEVEMQVAVGDKVIYSKYAGTEVKLDGEEFIVVRQNDIVAKVVD